MWGFFFVILIFASKLVELKKPKQANKSQTLNNYILKCKVYDITEDTQAIKLVYKVNKIGDYWRL